MRNRTAGSVKRQKGGRTAYGGHNAVEARARFSRSLHYLILSHSLTVSLSGGALSRAIGVTGEPDASFPPRVGYRLEPQLDSSEKLVYNGEAIL